MNGDEACTCGHTWDEHEQTGSSTPECAIEDCDCFAFEEAE